MNKTLLSAALIAGFGIASFTANAVTNTSSGTITINGTVVTSTCSASVNGTPAGTVTLPTVDTGTLTANVAAGWTPVVITLTGCGTITGKTSVTPYFWGSNINTTNGYLNNPTGSTAMVALSTAQSTTGALTLQNSYGNQGVASQLLTSSTTFSLYAGYVAPAAGASAGAVSTTVNYYLIYN